MPPLPRYEFDQQYIDRLIAGDPATEEHFSKYFGDLLFLKLRSRLRSPALVEDVRQETFVRVLSALKRGGLANAASLGAFVNAVSTNVLMETYRAGGRVASLEDGPSDREDETPGVEAALIGDEERAGVREAIAALPAKDRELLRWLFFEDRAKDDVCRELNVDRNYLRVLLHRAKARFREALQAESGRIV